MNWFQRYGIPGAYFYVLTLAWIAVCYPCKFNFIKENIENLVVLVIITFLPIGYILTIFQMLLYFIIPKLGIHRVAIKKAGLDSTKWKPETYFEAITHIHSINYAEKDIKLKKVKFMQDWIRKRMDILTINFTLFIATIVSPFLIGAIGLKCFLKWVPHCKNYCGIVIFSVFVIIFCSITYFMMRRSIIIVLVDYLKRIKETIPSKS